MYSKIMAPVDLAHTDQLERALEITADLAKRYGASVVYTGVTTTTPGPAAHSPEEFRRKLQAFADAQATKYGVNAEAHAILSHDPAVDLDSVLLAAIDETGADLVVMASHIPGVMEYVWGSNGGRVAVHAKVSVFIVRPA